jgi:hypothetical protein
MDGLHDAAEGFSGELPSIEDPNPGSPKYRQGGLKHYSATFSQI